MRSPVAVLSRWWNPGCVLPLRIIFVPAVRWWHDCWTNGAATWRDCNFANASFRIGFLWALFPDDQTYLLLAPFVYSWQSRQTRCVLISASHFFIDRLELVAKSLVIRGLGCFFLLLLLLPILLSFVVLLDFSNLFTLPRLFLLVLLLRPALQERIDFSLFPLFDLLLDLGLYFVHSLAEHRTNSQRCLNHLWLWFLHAEILLLT
mmetsp:Transcript_29592/g.55363  ORF Transcript_29592/g.55363 Transcript_29592/m.55363 type:complete len:205 (-) Transcript_29592:55-669(-)